VALIEWLKGRGGERPLTQIEPDAPSGYITTDVAAAQLILIGSGRPVTVRVGNGKKAPVPEGRFLLRTVRVQREKDGVAWFTSSTGPGGKPTRVRAGETTKVNLDPTVHFEAQAKRDKGELRLGFAIRGADGRGLSIYRDWKRVSIRYEVLDASGKALAGGRMNYG